MKRLSLAGLVLCVSIPHGVAQVVLSESFTGINADIPDGSLSGLADTRTVVTSFGPIIDVSLTVNISGTGAGAVNGDLYAYLVHDGTRAVLLNRVGLRAGSVLGYDDNGFNNVTFSDSASNGDVHSYRLTLFGNHNTPISPAPSPLTGTWVPDGRDILPTSAGSTFDSTTPSARLSLFNGLNPAGEWTLYVADVEGGGTSKLESWVLNLTVVPEPSTYAFVTAAALAGFGLFRRFRA